MTEGADREKGDRQTPKRTAEGEREARLAAALRANLRKRKLAQRSG
jgi:hypothetical protein